MPNFDILSLLNDVEDDEMEQQMVLAAIQVEQNVTKSAIYKKKISQA